MKQEDNIEKLFHGAFENFEVTPPVSVKTEIDKQLDAKKIKPRWIFWWSTIVILLLTGVVFAVVKGGFYNPSSAPGLTASDQHSNGSNTYSKTKNNPETPGNNSGSNQSESTLQLESENAEKQQSESSEVNKNGLPEKSNTASANPKKKTTYSVQRGSATGNTNRTGKMNGSAAGKNQNAASPKPKNAQTKKKVVKGTAATGNALKTNPKKKSRFTAKKGDSDSQNGQSTGSRTEGIKTENPAAEEKTTQTSPETKTGKESVVEAQKKSEPVDSLANVTALADSTNKTETETPTVKPPKDNSKARNWMLEIYGGPRFESKTSRTDFALKSANAYQIGLGFSRSINLGPLKYVTLDGEYGGGKESYRETTTTSSVYLAGIDSIPILDTTMTDTLGYTYVNIYDTLNQTTELNSNAQITRFAFGLRTQFNFDLGSGFGVAVSPGYYYSRSKYKFSDSLSTSSSSSQILLNLSVYYDWNRFRFRVGLDSRYELMGKNQNAYFDRRKSVLFTPQFGVAIKF